MRAVVGLILASLAVAAGASAQEKKAAPEKAAAPAPEDPLAISAAEHLNLMVLQLRQERDRLEVELSRVLGRLKKAEARIQELEKGAKK